MRVKAGSIYDDDDTIIIGMITNSQFLGRLARLWPRNGRFGKSKALNLISHWCVSYYKKYGHAPDSKIENIYSHWASKSERDKGQVKQIETILSQLSRSHERNGKNDYKYLCDIAERRFQEIELREMALEVEQALSLGDLDRAKRAAEKRPVMITQQSWFSLTYENIEPFSGSNLIEPLLVYPEPLNSFLGTAFTREAFVAIQAGEKVGKSLWLMDIAYRAMKAKRRVAYFEAGDHTESQFKSRLSTRISGHPQRNEPLTYPVALTVDEEIQVVNEERVKEACSQSHLQRGLAQMRKLGVRDPLRWHCYLAGMLGTEDIRSMIDHWGDDGWKPDVVIVDYADIMSANTRLDRRDSINEIWIGLRAISQEFKCLVVTATQADARSYDKQVMTKSNFSEDKRKMAHVTDFIGLIRPKDVEASNVTQVNFIVRRNEAYHERACCYVAGCPELGRPVVLSAQ